MIHKPLLVLSVLTALLLAAAPLGAASRTVTVASGQEPTSYAPIWVEQGQTVTFTVSGTWSMWSPSWGPVDCRGHRFFKQTSGHYLGTLMASVEGGTPFEVTHGLRISSRTSGYLVLYPHRSGYAHLATSGSLRVTVNGITIREMAQSSEARQAIARYRNEYLGSTITDLGWNGSIAARNAGSLPRQVLDKALTRINYFRSLAKLPPVRLSAERNRLAQHAALIMLANRKLSHYPDSSWACYSEAGKQGAAASNLGLPSLARIITEYIEDPGPNNSACGHRRWVLASKAGEFGFGAAADANHYRFAAEALHVTGNSATPSNLPEFIAWPPAGYLPSPLLFPRGSFALPLAKSRVNLAGASVTMKGENGQSIPVTLNALKDGADPAITWEIVPANANLANFLLSWSNKPVTVTVRGIKVDGVAKTWSWTFTLVTP